MTGRAAGVCAKDTAPEFARCGGGRGFGRGFARGRNWPMPGAIAPPDGQELATLHQQARQLQADLDLIQSRIQELEPSPT